jgi:UDP-galactopyranose mutase
MKQFGKVRQVFFIEDFVPCDHHLAYMEIHGTGSPGIKVLRSRLPQCLGEKEGQRAQTELLEMFLFVRRNVEPPLLWFCTPLHYPLA